jgi:hypothetical protein
MITRSTRPRFGLFAMMEGSTGSGLAKNLLDVFRIARDLEEGLRGQHPPCRLGTPGVWLVM